ncbi:group XV phospholipase a2 [Plakobranchus ocellatus]|uniref:Group XV phospholipase a2 n=1 Tax=Plakobranchus ocellatus TaxID=259542 RepID=A0AAV4BPE7_9GAST|nr:group XV phospholipase a2 [Plakobranchus ocellatus]
MNERARLKDDYRVVIDSNEENKGVGFLKEWADCAKSMTSTKGHVRQHCLTTDTGNALHHTCCALLDVSKFLLSTNTSVRHDFVLLGFFQQDDLEAHFGHFRIAAGCNFYITVQDVFSTHSIDKAKILVKYCDDIKKAPVSHDCEYCKAPLSDEEVYLIDEIPNMMESISKDEKLSLFYIAGYVASKSEEMCGEANDWHVEIKSFLETLNRGGLKYPKKALFILCLAAYLFFIHTQRLCRNRFVSSWRVFLEYIILTLCSLKIP